MNSRITVFFKGKKFFATAPKSILSISGLTKVFNVLDNKFPDAEGYTIEVTYCTMLLTRNDWKALIDFQNKIRAFLKNL